MKIHGYTTCKNVISMGYSLEECIEDFKRFCDKIIIFDTSDKDDGTKKVLENLQKDNRIEVYHEDWDYSVKNSGILDGQSKAKARELAFVGADWLIQKDLDECFYDESISLIRPLIEQVNGQNIDVIALPVVEPFGSLNQIRIDVNPWKERISRNKPDITHGIPQSLRKYKDGLLYATGGDGCNLISKTTGDPVFVAHFMTPQAESLRQAAVKDKRYIPHFEEWFNQTIEQLPTIFHTSWLSIEKKIHMYKSFWNSSWQSLYGNEKTSVNPFFDVPFDKVDDDMVKQKAKELREGTCGHIFHTKWNGQKNFGIKVNKTPPKFIKNWIETHKDE